MNSIFTQQLLQFNDGIMMNLENAPQHIQLAVDLIELLETNQVADDVAVEALRIVLADYERKLLDKND